MDERQYASMLSQNILQVSQRDLAEKNYANIIAVLNNYSSLEEDLLGVIKVLDQLELVQLHELNAATIGKTQALQTKIEDAIDKKTVVESAKKLKVKDIPIEYDALEAAFARAELAVEREIFAGGGLKLIGDLLWMKDHVPDPPGDLANTLTAEEMVVKRLAQVSDPQILEVVLSRPRISCNPKLAEALQNRLAEFPLEVEAKDSKQPVPHTVPNPTAEQINPPERGQQPG